MISRPALPPLCAYPLVALDIVEVWIRPVTIGDQLHIAPIQMVHARDLGMASAQYPIKKPMCDGSLDFLGHGLSDRPSDELVTSIKECLVSCKVMSRIDCPSQLIAKLGRGVVSSSKVASIAQIGKCISGKLKPCGGVHGQSPTLEMCRVRAGSDQPARSPYSSRISGCLIAMAISIRAAPDGSRLPCSQLRSVARLIPSKLAKASWLRFKVCRARATSV